MTAVMLDHEQAHEKTSGGDGDEERCPPITPGEGEPAYEPQRNKRRRRYREFRNAARVARLAIAAEDPCPVTRVTLHGVVVFDGQKMMPIGHWRASEWRATSRPCRSWLWGAPFARFAACRLCRSLCRGRYALRAFGPLLRAKGCQIKIYERCFAARPSRFTIAGDKAIALQA